MKKILFSLFFATVFTGSVSAYHTSSSGSTSSYYVADPVECRYIVYTCEYGYSKFVDTKGCGCTQSNSVQQVYTPVYTQTQPYQYNYATHSNIPQNISTSSSQYMQRYNSGIQQSYAYKYITTSEEKYIIDLVEDFIYNLERKNYSEGTTLSRIEKVIEKLEDLGSKNYSYRNITLEAISILEDYKDMREDGDIYEQIEDIFKRYD